MYQAPDIERQLALSYIPWPARERIAALWALDSALGQLVAGGREPMITRIKLAWWREALEALDAGPAPAEPVLQGLEAQVMPGGITGAELAAFEEGWSILATVERLDRSAVELHAARRGGLLFALSARLLGQAHGNVGPAGELWALSDLARRSSNAEEAAIAIAAGQERLARIAARWPAALRPLGMLAKLAARDVRSVPGAFETPGSPARMLAMLRHRLTGL